MAYSYQCGCSDSQSHRNNDIEHKINYFNQIKSPQNGMEAKVKTVCGPAQENFLRFSLSENVIQKIQNFGLEIGPKLKFRLPNT